MPKAKYVEFNENGSILVEQKVDYWVTKNETPECICISLPDGDDLMREVTVPVKDILKLINSKNKL